MTLKFSVMLLMLTQLAIATSAHAQNTESKPLGGLPDITSKSAATAAFSADEVRAGDEAMARDDVQGAIKHYRIAAQTMPYAGAYIGLGKAYTETGSYAEAAVVYQKLLEDPKLNSQVDAGDDPSILMSYGLALSKTGRDAEALSQCQRGLQILRSGTSPRLPLPVADLGDDKIKRVVSRKRLQAVAHIGIAVSGNGSVAPTLQQVKHAQAAAEAEPGLAWTHFYYARALDQAGGEVKLPDAKSRATVEFARAIQLGNDSTKQAIASLRK